MSPRVEVLACGSLDRRGEPCSGECPPSDRTGDGPHVLPED